MGMPVECSAVGVNGGKDTWRDAVFRTEFETGFCGQCTEAVEQEAIFFKERPEFAREGKSDVHPLCFGEDIELGLHPLCSRFGATGTTVAVFAAKADALRMRAFRV